MSPEYISKASLPFAAVMSVQRPLQNSLATSENPDKSE